MSYLVRHPIVQPFAGQPGKCVFCGSPVPIKKKWCGHCYGDYLRARGFFYRRDGLLDNRKRHGGKLVCDKCGTQLADRHVAVVDHVKALALGGTHVKANLQVLCEACNKAKTRNDLGAIRTARRAKGMPPLEMYH